MTKKNDDDSCLYRFLEILDAVVTLLVTLLYIFSGPGEWETSTKESSVYCHRCGRRAALSDVFCRSCGTKLRIYKFGIKS